MRQVILSSIIMTALMLALASLVTADVPQLINYQGQLTNSSGDPLDTTVSMEFTIYDDSTGGVALWTETHPTVSIDGGTFSVMLGEAVAIDYGLFNESERWFGVTVGADPELTPRTHLISVPYAYHALRADSAGDSHWSLKDSILSTKQYYGLTRGGCDNALYGDSSWTHTNLGVACTTGVSAGNIYYSTVGGGRNNISTQSYSTVSGGYENIASGYSSTTGGGMYCYAYGSYSTVAGGTYNEAQGNYSTVAGGHNNDAMAAYAMCPGGDRNRAEGRFSFAAGRQAIAFHDGVFVWGDSTEADFSSTGANQFLIRAGGGVGIGTNSPQGALDVSSTTGAFIVPRMTTTERDALTAVNGMIIYNTTDNQFNFYENDNWVTK